jgi:hypothetical protein
MLLTLQDSLCEIVIWLADSVGGAFLSYQEMQLR